MNNMDSHGYPIWDPPHGDYYSRPSQPKRHQYEGFYEGLVEERSRPYYFWLGRDAETL